MLAKDLDGLSGDGVYEASPRVKSTEVTTRRGRPRWFKSRRRFSNLGTVSTTIVEALALGQEMSVKAIRAPFEQTLDSPVSRFSVSDYLLTNSRGCWPLFERTRHGHYRLLPRA
jgi:hypothetical protein